MEKPLKPTERCTDAVLTADASVAFIGHVETPYATRADCPKQGRPDDGPDCVVVLNPPWDAALSGVEELKHPAINLRHIRQL
jgi:tRNA (adenine37-N6)-methyltransferase